MSEPFDPSRATKLAEEFDADCVPHLRDLFRSAAEQLRAAGEDTQRLDGIIRNWEGLAEGYLNRALTAEEDRDRLAARVKELEKLCGEACDIASSVLNDPDGTECTVCGGDLTERDHARGNCPGELTRIAEIRARLGGK